MTNLLPQSSPHPDGYNGPLFYKDTDTQVIYRVCQVASRMLALISLHSGNRYSEAVTIEAFPASLRMYPELEPVELDIYIDIKDKDND